MGVNWGTVLLLLAAVLVGAAFLWPYLIPDENQRALQRLTEVLQTWNGVRDLQAEVIVLRPGEPALRLGLLYLAGLAVRLEIKEPEELQGEVYALRAVPEGWLLVHFRPGLSLGLEARFPAESLGRILNEFVVPSPKRVQASWPREDVLRLIGPFGPFAAAEIVLGQNFLLPQRVLLSEADGETMEVQVQNLRVNAGLELRDLLLLDPLPTRWIRIPIPEGGA